MFKSHLPLHVVILAASHFAATGCETPAKPAEQVNDSLAPAMDSGFMSIAAPQGIAHGEYNIEVDFNARKGKWALKVIEDKEGFLDTESGVQLFGDRMENGDYIFTDVENYLKTKERDPAVAVTMSAGKVTKIVYGSFPTHLTKSKDSLKNIKRYSGEYSLTQEGETIPIEFSLVVNWNNEPAEGAYWQTHHETEGRVPERVAIADAWSFTSNEVKASSGSCKGCKKVAVYKQNEDDKGNLVTESNPAVTLEVSGDQKIQSLTAGNAKVKLAK